MKPLASLREALSDPQLLVDALPGPSWLPWRALLLAIRGEPLTAEELEAYRVLTARTSSPTAPVKGAMVIKGRRSGGSRALSLLLVYASTLVEYPSFVPGERALALMIAPDTKQAKIAKGYASAFQSVACAALDSR